MHFELVENDAVMSATLLSEQLDYGYAALVAHSDPALINRKRVLSQHDNTPAHTAALIKGKIKERPRLNLVLIQHVALTLQYSTFAYSLTS